ncbi:MAG TPA: hypothetical protein VML55_07595 [Planctomycetaceae bacterium]|nr:hypothetical protein [Planctomycetaceae bacterium]
MLWPALITMLVAGLAGMHVVVVKPLERQIGSLKQELSAVQREMVQLVAARTQVRETNTLLAALNEQGNQLADAGRALRTINRFRTDLENEAAGTAAVAEVLDRLIGLKNRAAAELTDMEFADVGLEALTDLKRQLVSESCDVYDARASLDELARLKDEVLRGGSVATALDSARRLIALRDDLAVQVEGFETAERNLAAFDRLKSQLQSSSSGIETAESVADELLALKDEIVLRGSSTETARHNARRLFSLRDELNVDRAGIEAAERNLGSLLGIQSRLADRSDDLVGAVQSLEFLIDFRDEIDAHVRSLEGVRRNLMDIALMETSVMRAVRVLEPLAELANLRRLGDAEIRQAARTILEQRATRLSRAGDDVMGTAHESLAVPITAGAPASLDRGTPVPDPLDEE